MDENIKSEINNKIITRNYNISKKNPTSNFRNDAC